ncbi:MAG: hypothetical protein EBE86_009995 [Hormoscilla sp. GUM202]|nr:hypothetical protein [Hormoscilla sp. GUM202]
MEIVGFRKPKRPPQPDADAEVAQKPTAANQPEREKKLTGPPARPTSLTQKPTRPKPRPQLKSEKKKFELKIVSSATNSEGEQFRPGDLVQLEVMGFATKARITSFYQAKENGEVWASYVPAGEEMWLGGCIQASQLSRATA